MKIVDGESWQVVMDPGKSANFLLFVRDTHNLSPVGPDVPPRLTGETRCFTFDLRDSVAKEGLQYSGWALHT